MRNAIQAKIINALLDKYERSAFYREDRNPTRRIMLCFYNRGDSDFPYYDIEQSERRISVNRAVIALKEKDLVGFSWADGERDHIVGKVWLNTDNLFHAYRAAEREPKSDIIDKVCLEIENVQKQVTSSWLCAFLQDAQAAITRKRSLISAIPSDGEERELLLRAIAAIDKLDGSEYTERLFSLQTFGDSKVFERSVRRRLLSILSKYLDGDDDDAPEDLLKQIGIVKYPEQFEFCGGLAVAAGSGRVDFGCLPSGSVIYSSDLSLGSISISSSVKTVITIENRANYIEYVNKMKKDDELLIYHGGQYSPRKRRFLRNVAQAAPKPCKWLHWSDIDYGGFIMLSRLRQEIDPRITPYRMNSGELRRYKNYTSSINKQYAEKLRELKKWPELSDCYECIDYMLANMLRLEQEIMLSDWESPDLAKFP
jgi:hypothetical protein